MEFIKIWIRSQRLRFCWLVRLKLKTLRVSIRVIKTLTSSTHTAFRRNTPSLKRLVSPFSIKEIPTIISWTVIFTFNKLEGSLLQLEVPLPSSRRTQIFPLSKHNQIIKKSSLSLLELWKQTEIIQHNESTFSDYFRAPFALDDWVPNRWCATKNLFAAGIAIIACSTSQ